MDQAQALGQLQRSSHTKLGPFTFDARGMVATGTYRVGDVALRFKGSYHRHHFYVFPDGEIVFLDDEDDDPLWWK